MTITFLFVILLLLVGVVIRERMSVFRWLYIPASVVAGFVGLIVIQWAANFGETDPGGWTDPIKNNLGSWPSWLIAVVFAGMLLERKPSSAGNSPNRIARQGLMVWIIVLGETAVGLLAVWLLVQPFFDVPNSFGMLIETGFAGGHGTAAAMGEVFSHPTVGLAEGRDLGMLMATVGLIYGMVAGIFWINIGVRAGWVDKPNGRKLGWSESDQVAIGYAKVEGSTIDPLLFQVIWLSLAFGIGWLFQFVVMQTAGLIDSWIVTGQVVDTAQEQLAKRLSVSHIVDFPLFIYTLFGGLIVRRLLMLFGQVERIDNKTIGRLTSSAMDVLVVSAIASLNLTAVAAMLFPFSILFICGAVWTSICLLFISRWILPEEYWFQLGLINFGMSTGTTATGFVLLRMVDPDLATRAAEDYALAAPLSAPFIGGGIMTIALPLLVLERISVGFSAIAVIAVVVVLVLVGRRFNSIP